MKAYLDRIEPSVRREFQRPPTDRLSEYYVGQVIQEALKSNLKIAHVIFDNETYTDIGTPDSLVSAMTNRKI
jgi:dTDP-glucose pyrophosphorylase